MTGGVPYFQQTRTFGKGDFVYGVRRKYRQLSMATYSIQKFQKSKKVYNCICLGNHMCH